MNLGSLMVAGVVGVLVSLLALRDGFAATLGATGRLAEAIVLRAGSNAALSSRLTRADRNVIGEAPGILRNAANRPLVWRSRGGPQPAETCDWLGCLRRLQRDLER